MSAFNLFGIVVRSKVGLDCNGQAAEKGMDRRRCNYLVASSSSSTSIKAKEWRSDDGWFADIKVSGWVSGYTVKGSTRRYIDNSCAELKL